jgi:hypothetical protein
MVLSPSSQIEKSTPLLKFLVLLPTRIFAHLLHLVSHLCEIALSMPCLTQ